MKVELQIKENFMRRKADCPNSSADRNESQWAQKIFDLKKKQSKESIDDQVWP